MRLFVIILAIMGAFTGRCLHAAIIMSPDIRVADSIFSYNYTVTNTESHAVLGLDMLIGAEPVSTTAPAGWFTVHVRFGDAFLVQWIADVQTIASGYLAPGQSMNGFVIEVSTRTRLEPVAFRAYDMNLQSIGGTTTAPHPTPEPGTVLLMSIGLGSLLTHRRLAGRPRNCDHKRG